MTAPGVHARPRGQSEETRACGQLVKLLEYVKHCAGLAQEAIPLDMARYREKGGGGILICDFYL